MNEDNKNLFKENKRLKVKIIDTNNKLNLFAKDIKTKQQYILDQKSLIDQLENKEGEH